MRVVKWGKGLAIQFPAELVRQLQIGEGDEVTIRAVASRELALTFQPNKEEAIAALQRFEGRAPVDFKFDREDANHR